MTQANESLGLSASQHIEKILQHCNGSTMNGNGAKMNCHSDPDPEQREGEESPHLSYPKIFDYALINTAPISPTLLEKYARGGQAPIAADLDRIRALGIEPIAGDFTLEGSLLRHDPDRVTQALLALVLARSA
jgi:hypothetical protein